MRIKSNANAKNTNQNSTIVLSNNSFIMKASAVAVAVLMGVSTPIGLSATASADSYQDRINVLQDEIGQYQAKAGELQEKAHTLQGELERLANEKAVIQGQVDLIQAKYDKLVADIKANEEKLTKNQDVLGEIMATIYMDDKISSIELLASSKNVSDFVDKQEYRTAVQERFTSTVTEVRLLKKQLEKQRIQVDRELTNSKNAHEALAAKEAEHQTLLEQTQGEEASYQQLANERQEEADRLRAEQLDANQRAAQRAGSQTLVTGVAGGGEYPGNWANAPMDTIVDSWGLYNRECVSYAAWKVASTGRFVPHFGGMGNANQWESTVSAYGIQSGSEPRVGSVAVLYEGAYGHVMYVEEVNGGQITISEYNYGWSGTYSKRTISSAGLTYIYF